MNYLYVNDTQIENACKLHGVDPRDGNRVIYDIIPKSFGCRLVRYQRFRSTLGGFFGRWKLRRLESEVCQ